MTTPVTCITAYELREAGIPVPDNIPGVGWVPRTSVRYGAFKAEKTDDPTKFVFTAAATFDEPFRWVEGEYTVDTPEELR